MPRRLQIAAFMRFAVIDEAAQRARRFLRWLARAATPNAELLGSTLCLLLKPAKAWCSGPTKILPISLSSAGRLPFACPQYPPLIPLADSGGVARPFHAQA